MALLPDVTSFPYGKGVGIPSWQAIINLAGTSGIPFNVSSTVRTAQLIGHPDYHNTGNAVDLTASQANMVKLAQWFESNYTPYMLELIHSGGGGFFVKNGKQVTASFYGADTVSQHYNHVHIAMTNDGVNAAHTGASPTVNPAVATLTGFTNPLDVITKLTDNLTNPSLWYRVGLGVVGIVGIIVGVYVLWSEELNKVGKSIVGS
jgi:hypothetical protein